MSEAAQKNFDDLLSLDADERTALIIRLLDTIEAADADVDGLWRAEVRKRIADIESGKRVSSTWKEAKERIFAP